MIDKKTLDRLEALPKDKSCVLAIRIEKEISQKLSDYAQQQGLKKSQLVRSWIMQRMQTEGL